MNEAKELDQYFDWRETLHERPTVYDGWLARARLGEKEESEEALKIIDMMSSLLNEVELLKDEGSWEEWRGDREALHKRANALFSKQEAPKVDRSEELMRIIEKIFNLTSETLDGDPNSESEIINALCRPALGKKQKEKPCENCSGTGKIIVYAYCRDRNCQETKVKCRKCNGMGIALQGKAKE